MGIGDRWLQKVVAGSDGTTWWHDVVAGGGARRCYLVVVRGGGNSWWLHVGVGGGVTLKKRSTAAFLRSVARMLFRTASLSSQAFVRGRGLGLWLGGLGDRKCV